MGKKHVLLPTRQDVLSSATHTHTHTFLSISPSHRHASTHTQSVSIEALCQAREKQNLNRPDLLDSELEQRIMGARTLCILGRLLPVSCCSLSVCFNFNLMHCLCKHMKKEKKQHSKVAKCIGLNLDSAFPLSQNIFILSFIRQNRGKTPVTQCVALCVCVYVFA